MLSPLPTRCLQHTCQDSTPDVQPSLIYPSPHEIVVDICHDTVHMSNMVPVGMYNVTSVHTMDALTHVDYHPCILAVVLACWFVCRVVCTCRSRVTVM
jgi:hypothetical protein